VHIYEGAMNQLTRSLACEWAKDNIRTNCVAPWFIWTPLTDLVRTRFASLCFKLIKGKFSLKPFEFFFFFAITSLKFKNSHYNVLNSQFFYNVNPLGFSTEYNGEESKLQKYPQLIKKEKKLQRFRLGQNLMEKLNGCVTLRKIRRLIH